VLGQGLGQGRAVGAPLEMVLASARAPLEVALAVGGARIPVGVEGELAGAPLEMMPEGGGACRPGGLRAGPRWLVIGRRRVRATCGRRSS